MSSVSSSTGLAYLPPSHGDPEGPASTPLRTHKPSSRPATHSPTLMAGSGLANPGQQAGQAAVAFATYLITGQALKDGVEGIQQARRALAHFFPPAVKWTSEQVTALVTYLDREMQAGNMTRFLRAGTLNGADAVAFGNFVSATAEKHHRAKSSVPAPANSIVRFGTPVAPPPADDRSCKISEPLAAARPRNGGIKVWSLITATPADQVVSIGATMTVSLSGGAPRLASTTQRTQLPELDLSLLVTPMPNPPPPQLAVGISAKCEFTKGPPIYVRKNY